MFASRGLPTNAIAELLVRPPGTVVPEGLLFYRRCFFRQPHLRGPEADRRKTLPHDSNLVESPAKVGQVGGPPLKNFRGQKHAQFPSIFCNVQL